MACARCKLLLLKEFDKTQYKHNGHLAHAFCPMAGLQPNSRDYLAAQKLLIDAQIRADGLRTCISSSVQW